jgi:hypothetical protein
MRTVERFSFIFGIANLILGVLAFFSPFVAERRTGIGKFLPRRHSLINRRPGMLLGALGAVNPPHAVLHSALGAAGLATRPWSKLSRAYMWVNGLLFAALAVMGWARVGFKPGIHNVMGIALDWRDNVLNTLWAAGSILLAVRPDLGQRAKAAVNRAVDQGMEMAQAGMAD